MSTMLKRTSDYFEPVELGVVSIPGDLKQSVHVESSNPVVDPALEKRVLRKIDIMIIPFICVTYLVTYIDKAMLGYSAVFGSKESLHLHGSEYSWLGSMFYFGYLAFEYPTTFAMQKVPVSKWLSLNLFLWGGLTMALAGCGKFGSFLALRFLIGALESCSTPAYLLITATWYTIEEQPIRIGWWSTFLGLANSFGGLLAFAIGHINGSLEPWQYQFIIIGAITRVWAAFMYFTLAERPSMAQVSPADDGFVCTFMLILLIIPSSWLNEEEKEAAIRRLGSHHLGANHQKIKKYQIVEALMDPKTWFFFLFGVSTQVVNGAVSNFGSLIIHGFGYSSFVTTLLQIPYGMLILLSNVSAMYLQRWLQGQARCIVALLYVIPSLAGAVGIHTVSREHKVALLVCYLLTSTYTASFAMIMSLITANTGGSTKRSVVSALFFVSCCVGNIIGPFAFKSSEAPTYTSGIVAIFVAYCVEIFLLIAFAFYCALLNRQKDKAMARDGLSDRDTATPNTEQNGQGLAIDQTDKEDPYFRYTF